MTRHFFRQDEHTPPPRTVLHASPHSRRAGDVREHAAAGTVKPGACDADPSHQRSGGHDGLQVPQ